MDVTEGNEVYGTSAMMNGTQPSESAPKKPRKRKKQLDATMIDESQEEKKTKVGRPFEQPKLLTLDGKEGIIKETYNCWMSPSMRGLSALMTLSFYRSFF